MSSGSRRTVKQMSATDLEKRIIQFLKTTNMCLLATCSNGVPRATPIEYHSKGLTINFVGEPGTKLKNIKINPNVSIGIFLQCKGWDNAKRAQITEKRKKSPGRVWMNSEKAWRRTSGKKPPKK